MIGPSVSALVLPLTIALASAPAPHLRTSLDQRTRRSDTQVYFSFIVYGDDFCNPDESAAVVRRLLDLFDANQLPAEFVVSAAVAAAWQATSGDVVERLRRGPYTVSYVCRPPHPVCFPGELNRRLAKRTGVQRRDALRQLETHGWDPTTGEANTSGVGGYSLVKEIFGRAPWAVVPNATSDQLRDDHVAVLRELGARVVTLDTSLPPNGPNPIRWHSGLLVRPFDFDLTTVGPRRRGRNRKRNRWAWWWHHAGRDLLGDPAYRLRQHMQRTVPGRVYFGLIRVHDHDFYAKMTPWWRIYYGSWRSLRARKPPFAFTHRGRKQPYRECDTAQKQAIWRAYEKLVSAVARNAQIRAVTSRELVAMVAHPPADSEARLVPARVVLPPKDTWTQPVPTEMPAKAQTRLLIGLFLQAQPSQSFVTNEAYFRAKARLCEELAEMLAKHGARLTVQADVELAHGAETFDPEFIRRLHDKHQVEFSLRTDLRPVPGTSLDHVLRELKRRKETFEQMGSGPITDLCGGFDLDDPSVLAPLGFRTQTAMRNPYTRRSYGRFYVHPWRVSKASPWCDEVTWARPDPEGKIVFLPGQGTFGPRTARTLRDRIYPSLVHALNVAKVAHANTWYALTHVDSFRSTRGLSLTEYMASPEHRQHLAVYEKVLAELFDPLVKQKYVRWATPSEMYKSFLWWDRHRFRAD